MNLPFANQRKKVRSSSRMMCPTSHTSFSLRRKLKVRQVYHSGYAVSQIIRFGKGHNATVPRSSALAQYQHHRRPFHETNPALFSRYGVLPYTPTPGDPTRILFSRAPGFCLSYPRGDHHKPCRQQRFAPRVVFWSSSSSWKQPSSCTNSSRTPTEFCIGNRRWVSRRSRRSCGKRW